MTCLRYYAALSSCAYAYRQAISPLRASVYSTILHFRAAAGITAHTLAQAVKFLSSSFTVPRRQQRASRYFQLCRAASSLKYGPSLCYSRLASITQLSLIFYLFFTPFSATIRPRIFGLGFRIDFQPLPSLHLAFRICRRSWMRTALIFLTALLQRYIRRAQYYSLCAADCHY